MVSIVPSLEEAWKRSRFVGGREECEFRLGHGEFKDTYETLRGDEKADLGVAFQTHPGRQAFISSGSKDPRSALEGTGKSGCFPTWKHPRGHVWNVVVRPASS